MCDSITGKKLEWVYSETNRIGDHIWWISNLSRFQEHYPTWKMDYDVEAILREIYEVNYERWQVES
jgi:CDP-paratose 2-epimerase